MRLATILLSLLLLGPVLPARVVPAQASAPAVARLDDGPYVIWDGPVAKVLRVRDGKAEVQPLPRNGRLELDGLPALALSPKPFRPAPCRLPLPDRIAAVSDIHGNFTDLVILLQRHHIIDPRQRWSFGRGQLVVAGDVFDRGAGVTESLWLLRSLEEQAASAGGRVHVLLGNHEAMALNGDLRYLNPKYAAVAGLLGQGIPALYGPDSDTGRWLRSRNVMLLLGDILFAHGGPSPALAAGPIDLEALNVRFRQALDAGGKPELLGSDGPVWYRGLIPGASRTGDTSDAELGTILKACQARLLVVGHSTLDQITAFHDGRVFGIDAGLQHPGHGELWLWEKGRIYRGLLDGRRLPLPRSLSM
jgi:hypothetical protein